MVNILAFDINCSTSFYYFKGLSHEHLDLVARGSSKCFVIFEIVQDLILILKLRLFNR